MKVKKLLSQMTCDYCARFCWPTKDHVVPKQLGGRLSPCNVAYVCRECNQSKGNVLLRTWIRLLPNNHSCHVSTFIADNPHISTEVTNQHRENREHYFKRCTKKAAS